MSLKQLLTQTTNDAVAAHEEAERLRKVKIAKKNREEETKIRIKAMGVIDNIRTKCLNAAESMKTHCDIYDIPYGERKDRSNKCDHRTLSGAAALIWNYCVDNDLNPTCEFWHDGVGIRDGFYIRVHWDK